MIEARGLTKRYGDLLALDDLNLTVRPGEIYGLLGGAGAGKTTVFRLFMSATVPTRGQALVGGADATIDPLVSKQQACFVTTQHPLFASLTVRRNLEFFVHMGDPRLRAARISIENAMRRVGVPERCFDRRCTELTDDVSLLVWLAIARLRDTAALFLDDPTTKLSARGAEDLQDSLLDLRSEGRAVLITTSDVSFVTHIADRVAILQSGRKVVERTRAEFLTQSLTQFHLHYAGRSVEREAPSQSGL